MRTRPFSLFSSIRQTSLQWSRFLDEYSDRFKIQYPLADDDNDLYFPVRPGRYPVSVFFCFLNYPSHLIIQYQTSKDLPILYAGLKSSIEPATNPFRQLESKQKSTIGHSIWIPYGTPPRRS